MDKKDKKTKKIHVKKGDTVLVLSGKDAGRQGKILAVETDKGRVVVEDVNMRTKHKKPRGPRQQGGIMKQSNSIDASNVMLICEKCGRPTRIAKEVLENGQKSRKCKKCNEIIDRA